MAIGRPHLVIATAVAAALLPAPCTFSQIPHSQGVVPAEAVAGDQFGYSVAVSGNRAVVGAPGDDERGGDAGAVYILERVGGTWSVVGKLLATDAVGGWNFGFSVDVWGDRIVVGAPTASVAGELFGAAYVFERIAGQWIQTAQLSPTPLAGSFGHDVAIHGDFIAVGASGRVTFFQRINGTWTQIGTGSFSGSVSVDLDGLRAVSGGFHSVTISEFDGTTFATTQILPLPIGDASVDAVTIHGDTIVVGASADDPIDAGVNTGAAYIVRRIGDTWTHEQTLAGAFAGDHFGASVALSDDLLLVGAPRADVTGFDSGAAVLFQRIGTSWFWVDEMVASGADLYADFGTSVALDGAHGFVGRPALLVPNGSSGSAHFYLLADCDTDGLVDAIEIALGLGVDCNENWVLDSCELAAGAPDVNGNNVLDVCESDCNDNGIPDTMEIALGFVADCNANGRPDDCALRPRPVDLVFIMDTSGSMDDEGQALCAAIDLVGQTLQQQGIDLNATLYGITSLGYGCLSNTVAAALGPAIPQPAPCCPEIMMVED